MTKTQANPPAKAEPAPMTATEPPAREKKTRPAVMPAGVARMAGPGVQAKLIVNAATT